MPVELSNRGFRPGMHLAWSDTDPNSQHYSLYFRSHTQIALCAISEIHYLDREGAEPVLGTCIRAWQIHNPRIPPTSQTGFIINWLIEEDKATIEAL